MAMIAEMASRIRTIFLPSKLEDNSLELAQMPNANTITGATKPTIKGRNDCLKPGFSSASIS